MYKGVLVTRTNVGIRHFLVFEVVNTPRGHAQIIWMIQFIVQFN